MLIIIILLLFQNLEVLDIELLYKSDSISKKHMKISLYKNDINNLRNSTYQFHTKIFQDWFEYRSNSKKNINQFNNFTYGKQRNIVYRYFKTINRYNNNLPYNSLDSLGQIKNELDSLGYSQLARNMDFTYLLYESKNNIYSVNYFKIARSFYNYSLKIDNHPTLRFYFDFSQALNFVGLKDINIKFLNIIDNNDVFGSVNQRSNKLYFLNLFYIQQLLNGLVNIDNSKINFNDIDYYDFLNIQLYLNDFNLEDYNINSNLLYLNQKIDIDYRIVKNSIENQLKSFGYVKFNINSEINNLKIENSFIEPLRLILNINDRKLYIKVKSQIEKQFNTIFNSTLLNSKEFNNELLAYYIIMNNSLFDYFDISKYKPMYTNIIKPKLMKNDVYKKLYQSKADLYKQIDLDSVFDPYFKLADIFSKEVEIKKEMIKDSIYPMDSYNSIRKRIDKNSSILLLLKAFALEKVYLIKNDTMKTFDFDSTLNFIKDIPTNDKIYISDNSNLLKNQFEVEFLKVKKKIPKVTYIDYLQEFNDSTFATNISSSSFHGLDKAFKFKGKSFSKLFDVETEGLYLDNEFNTNIHLNNADSIDFTSDIVHLSGHFIKSKFHPIYNKIAYGIHNDEVQNFAGYDTYREEINSKLIFINACESGQSKTFDPISGTRNFAEFLMDAGAKTVIVNNVDVDDYSASIFSKVFYEYLADGNDAISSIQKAKIYLYENISKDPTIWNAAKLYGDNLKVNSSYTMYLYVVILLLLIIASIIIYTKKINHKYI